ncbi:DUF4386 family protein [Rhodobacteraceae bacterium RKSG542]|uniref:DUF4386 family protein n=1 Tax=Pseudovibrio flavus TaxID=2529854 RepID=UPI0012BC96A7|nr:DUF4386 family protein [Pseudovibrio flavus]MTI18467.1 DUF4386 family protein [Pseudovibrio flavus]
MNFQRVGGLASLAAAGTYIFGMGILFAVLMPAGYDSEGAASLATLELFKAHQTVVFVWYFVIYVLNGVVLLALVLALHERLKRQASHLSQLAAGFGVIWCGLVIASGMVATISFEHVMGLLVVDPAAALLQWQMLSTVVEGLGGGNEIVGALWVLLLSIAGLRSKALPRFVSGFGILVGVAGLSTIIPALSGAGGAFFGLGCIIWFLIVGITLFFEEPKGAKLSSETEAVSGT